VIRRLLLLLAATLAAKAAVLAQLGSHPLLQPYGETDSGVYARLAWRIAHGDLLLRGEGPVPYFVSPLYAYFLAATGVSLPAARVVQILLGTAAVALVFLTARRLFGERAALPAGVLFALTGVVSFHEVLILQAALDPFLTALFLYLLALALTEGEEKISLKVIRGGTAASGGARRAAAALEPGRVSSKVWVAAGAAGGLLALNRPNALLCVAAIVVALAITPAMTPLAARGRSDARRPSYPFEENSLRRVRIAAVFVGGAAATIAPFTLRNFVVSHELVLISSHGGLNFLVGNGPGANGVYRALPGITPDIGGQREDSRKVAEAAEGRSLSSGEISEYFAKKAWSWIRESPGAAFSLFLRKIRFTLSGDEAPLNFSFPWYREHSSALKLLAVGPGLLVPLAGAGLVLALVVSAGAARRSLLVWAAFIPSYVIAVAAFFVATRYRLPLLVALAPLAGAAVAKFPEAWRAKRGLGLAAGAAVVLAAVSLWPTGLWDGAADEEMHLVLWEIEQRDAAAMRHAEAAAPLHPDPALFWLRVGRSFEAAGKSDEAIAAYGRSLASATPRPEAATGLSALLEQRGLARVKSGDAAGGRADLEEAVRLDGASAEARLNLAVACGMAGETDRARALAKETLALQPGYENARAFLEALDRSK
jgi:tetratricopeptide (TPR) repeat protein